MSTRVHDRVLSVSSVVVCAAVFALPPSVAAQTNPPVADVIFGTCPPETYNFTTDACWIFNWVYFQKHVSHNEFIEQLRPQPGTTSVTLAPDRAPWAANYLAWDKGGIARRLHLPHVESATMADLQWERIVALPQQSLDALSPIEKYDLVFGNRDFRATRHEIERRGTAAAGIQYWEGFCNGMRAAGVLTEEPVQAVQRVITEGNRSITVRFEPADIRALLGAAYFYVEDDKYGQAGRNLVPVNPAALDVSLRLVIGQLGHGFFVDASTEDKIFNETIVGYDRQASQPREPITEDSAVAGTASVVKVETVIYLLAESSLEDMNRPTSARVAQRDTGLIGHKQLSYLLFLDSGGFIQGGRWDAPPDIDAIWFASGRGADMDHHTGIDRNTGQPYRGNPHLDWLKISALLSESTIP
jgi:hypothetical protein